MTIILVTILMLLIANMVTSIYVLKQIREMKNDKKDELEKVIRAIDNMEDRIAHALSKLTNAQSKINQGFVECLKVLSKCTNDIRGRLHSIQKSVKDSNKLLSDYTQGVGAIIKHQHSESECIEEHMQMTISTMTDILKVVRAYE